MVWYNYRRVPAVTLAKQLIDEGRLGRIFHYRAKFLQDWTISTDLPQGGEGLWRLDVAVAGSGVTGDLLAHCIDTAMWLNGGIDEVTAVTETFIKSRKHNLTGKVEPVGIDDASLFLARFGNGSLATFEATRYARGHKALYTLEINGENASIIWDLHDLHRLQYFDHRDEGRLRGWRSIHITDRDHPYMKHWWVPGLQIGYEHTFIHQAADFLTAAGEGKSAAPTFRDALLTDYVTDAVLESAANRSWVKVRRITGVKMMLRAHFVSPRFLSVLCVSALSVISPSRPPAPAANAGRGAGRGLHGSADRGNRLPAHLRRQVPGRAGTAIPNSGASKTAPSSGRPLPTNSPSRTPF